MVFSICLFVDEEFNERFYLDIIVYYNVKDD